MAALLTWCWESVVAHPWVVASSLAFLIPFVKFYWKRYTVYLCIDRLPGPSSLPIIGTIHHEPRSSIDLLHYSMDCMIKYGLEVGMFRLWYGPEPWIIVVDPTIAKTIIGRKSHIEKAFLYDFLAVWLGRGLLTSTGDKWNDRRRLLTPCFHFDILTSYLEVFCRQADTLVNILGSTVRPGEEFDVYRPIKHCTLDIICETAMGITVDAQHQPSNEYVTCVEAAQELVFDRMRTPPYYTQLLYNLSQSGRLMNRCMRVMHGFTESVIAARRESMRVNGGVPDSKKKAFLDLLLTAKTEDGLPLTDSDIREEVDTFMFEGHDTTANAISYTVWQLGRNPDIQARVQAEIDDVLGSKTLFTMEELNNLPYTEMVIKESLRMCPSVAGIARVLDSDVVVGDYRLPKGATAVISIVNLHYNPSIWPSPHTFDPERHTTAAIDGRPPFSDLSFSAGPRNCIGWRFALLEEKCVIAKLVQKYTFTSFGEVVQIPEIVTRPATGMRVSFTPRK